MKKWISCFLIVALLIPNLQTVQAVETGTTITSGTIASDTIWTKEGSPYKVTSGFGLADGVTLTIEKGVIIQFAKNTGFSADYGKLIVNGTQSEKVIFEFPDTADGKEMYNEEISIGSNSQLKNFEIHEARRGLVIDGQNNLIENALISDNDFYGLYLVGKNNRINNSNLLNNQNGIYFFGNDNILIGNTIDATTETAIDINSNNNIFINNTISRSGAYGLFADESYYTMINRFYNNTFRENHNGILTGTANIFHQNNLLDSFNIIQSDYYNMDLSENYWGRTDREAIFQKITEPQSYIIKIDPYKYENTGLLEKIDSNLPVINPVMDNDSFITGKADPGDKVTITQKYSYWTSVKEAMADEKGIFQLEFSKVPAGEKVEAYATNQYGIKSSIVVTSVLDGTKPEAPVVEEVSNLSSIVKGTGEKGTTVVVKKEGQSIGDSVIKENGSFEVAIPVQTAGTILTITLTDKSQNTSEPGTVIVKDRIAPKSPEVNPIASNSTSITGVTEAGVTVYLYRPGRYLLAQTKAEDDGHFHFEISAQPVGTQYILEVVDLNGNRSAEKIVKVELPAPAIEPFTDSMTLLKGKTEPNALVLVNVENTTGGEVTSDSNGNFQYTLGQQKAGANIKITVFKSGFSIEKNLIVQDVTPPNPPNVDQITENWTKVTGVAERFSTISVKNNGVEIASGTVNNAMEFTIDIPAQKAGTILEVDATDLAGNRSAVTRMVVASVPLKAPKVSLVTNKASYINGQADVGVTIIVLIGGYKYIGTADTKGLFKIKIPVQNAGTTISVTAKESASKVSQPTVIKVTRVAPNMPTVNAVTNKATYVSGRTEAYATVSVIIAGKVYHTKADAKGIYKVAIPVQNAGVRILIAAKDSSKNISETKVITTVKIAPNMPTVNLVRSYSTAITGKTESYVSVIVKIGSKTYNAKANKIGDFKVFIPKQRKGTKISIYVKDSKGQISAIKTMVVL